MDMSTLKNLAEEHKKLIKKKNQATRNTIVINAFAGAGAGKTTACLEICEKLKKLGYVTEYVQEYAKELVWDNNMEMLDGSEEHQFEILKEQMKRQDRLIGKVDFCVTDSPLLLNGIYNKQLTPEYNTMIHSLFRDYNNFSFFVKRDTQNFEQKGRIHNLAESIEIDKEVTSMLKKANIYFGTYTHATIEQVISNAITTYNRCNKLPYTSEEYQQMSNYLKENVSILSVANDLGFTPIRKGQKYYSLKEHDSVRIDTEKNCFWRNADASIGASGSVVDFITYFSNSDTAAAYQYLYDKVGGRKEVYNQLFSSSSAKGKSQIHQSKLISSSPSDTSDQEKKKLELPKPDSNMKNVYAYLHKTRCIPNNIIQEFVDRKMLYQDTHKNCVFVSKDNQGTPIYASMRGTSTFQRFVGDCPGCDYSKGFRFTNKDSSTLYITESVIDGMSKMSMLQESGISYLDYSWHFLTGTNKIESLSDYVNNPDIKEVIIGLDNDEWGHKATSMIQDMFKDSGKNLKVEYPKGKDWNKDISPHEHEKKRSNPIKECQEKNQLEMEMR